MPSQHAKLSPSSSERWLECPASVRMSEQVPPGEDSPYAREGTAAHALGELKARWVILKELTDDEFFAARVEWENEYEDILSMEGVDLDDMERHTDAYVQILIERLAVYPNSVLLLEQRLDSGVPRCWGTSDAVIVSPIHVESIDLKYGAGIMVQIEGNSQLRLYVLGALDNIADLIGTPQIVIASIFQPRIGPGFTTVTMTPEEIRAWREDVVLPIAEEALSDDAHFGPSEDACRWCPASGRCKAQLEAVFATDFEDDFDPDVATPDDIATALGKVPLVRQWLKDVEKVALTMAYSEGVEIPGHKVVLSGGKRVIPDSDGAIEHLAQMGYSHDQVAKKTVRGIGELEKLLGKADFKIHMEDAGFVEKTEGRPSLVHESDKRPAINPNSEAATAFAEEG